MFAWEPRGAWDLDTIDEICERLDLIHVIDPLKTEGRLGEIRYLRLHGPGGYRTSYSEEDLVALKAKVLDGTLTYIFFNNSDMVRNGLRLLEMVGKQPDGKP